MHSLPLLALSSFASPIILHSAHKCQPRLTLLALPALALSHRATCQHSQENRLVSHCKPAICKACLYTAIPSLCLALSDSLMLTARQPCGRGLCVRLLAFLLCCILLFFFVFSTCALALACYLGGSVLVVSLERG